VDGAESCPSPSPSLFFETPAAITALTAEAAVAISIFLISTTQNVGNETEIKTEQSDRQS
jgi:hypothetical protein